MKTYYGSYDYYYNFYYDSYSHNNHYNNDYYYYGTDDDISDFYSQFYTVSNIINIGSGFQQLALANIYVYCNNDLIHPVPPSAHTYNASVANIIAINSASFIDIQNVTIGYIYLRQSEYGGMISIVNSQHIEMVSFLVQRMTM